MLKFAWTAITGALGGIQTYLIVGAITAVISLGAGAYAGYRWEHGALLELQLADAKANQTALDLQHKSDLAQAKVSLNAAVKEAQAQDALNVRTVTLIERIPAHVTPAQDTRIAAACGITVGFYRVLRAGQDGVTPEALDLAPGQSDDDCADVAASALARSIAQSLGDGLKNAEQLNALEAEIRANHAVQLGTIPLVGDSP